MAVLLAALLAAALPAAAATAAPTPAAMSTRSGRSPVRGLDISAYQHAGASIDWRTLARGGVRFVAIKVTEGAYYSNPYYRSDARAAAKAGLAVMPYVFANPSRAGGAATARFAVRAARYRRGPAELPLAVDLEDDPYARSDCYRQGRKRMVAWIAGFISRARALTGKRPVIYTTDAWWRECTGSTGRFRSDPLWLAAYDTGRPSVPSPWHRWAFWQYDNDGSLRGIGRTDLDYFQPTGELSSLRPAATRKKAHAKKHPKRKHKARKHPKHKARKHKARKHPKRKHKARKHKAHKPKHHKARKHPTHRHKAPKRHAARVPGKSFTTVADTTTDQIPPYSHRDRW